MKKLTIKDLITFSKKTEKSQKTFVNNIQIDKPNGIISGGGDYWITAISAIVHSFKNNNNSKISEKIIEVQEKTKTTDYQRTIEMYNRNISLLHKYQNFNFNIIRPTKKLTFLKKSRSDVVLNIKGIKIKASPQFVFSFSNEKVGAIWFVANIDGFSEIELAMFTDLLQRYLVFNYSEEYEICEEYCITFDVMKQKSQSFAEIKKKEIPLTLDETAERIKSML